MDWFSWLGYRVYSAQEYVTEYLICMMFFGPWFYYLFWHVFARMMATFDFEICTEFINIWCAAQYAGLHVSINSSRMSVLQSIFASNLALTQLFYWSGTQEIVFSSSATWRRHFGNIKSLPVISESENRIYFAVNFGGNCRSIALIKPGTHRKMSGLRIGNFYLRFVTL